MKLKNKVLPIILSFTIMLSASIAHSEDIMIMGDDVFSFDDSFQEQLQIDDQDIETADGLFAAGDELLVSTIVSSGTKIWRIAGTEVICADAVTQQDTARIAVDDLLSVESNPIRIAERAGADWLGLVARDEQSVWLCASVTDDAGALHVLLFGLALAEKQISVTGVTDVTDTLHPFFDHSRDWLEIDMTACAAGILISALDQDTTISLFRWDVSAGKLTELGVESPLLCLAVIPYKSGALLPGLSLGNDNMLDLRILDLESGECSSLETIGIETDPSSAGNFAWLPAENLLCYTVGNTAYRITLGSGERPIPFAVTDKTPVENRLGVIAGNQFVLYAEDGSLIYCDFHAELKATRVRIADASGSEELPDLASQFNGQRKDIHASVTVCSDESRILEQMLNQSTDYDIYVITTDSGLYSALKNRGFYVDLSGNDAIRAAVADMPESIRTLVSEDTHLTGLPILTQNNALLLNVKAFQELTGCSKEEIPTDWLGMLQLLKRLSDDGILMENPRYTVYESDYTAGLKEDLFALILNDCLLWQNQSGASPDDLTAILLPVLQEFSTISWDRFGLSDEESDDRSWRLTDETIPLFSTVQAEIAVMDLDDGMEYWPLSMSKECPRLIPEIVSVMIINPWSAQSKDAQFFLEYAWENLSVLAKMSLNQKMNEPVKNTAYDEDVDYLEQLITSYQDQIKKAESEEEAESLRREMDNAEEFLAGYRKNASWLASESSIAEYRALSTQFAPAVPEFWSVDEEDAAVLQFLDGMMPAEQFVIQFVSALKMALLEGE